DESKRDFAGKDNKEKVQHLRWMSFLNSDFIMTFVKIVYPKDEATKAEGLASFAKHASYINNILAEGNTKFLVADRILAADIFAYETIRRIKEAGVNISEYPHIVKYMEEVGHHEILSNN
ncbi:hypothetical protein CANINC_002145, partial [Pichia inconspicua]